MMSYAYVEIWQRYLNLPSKCADKADKYNDIRKYFTDKIILTCSLRDYIDTISNPRIRDIFLTAF